LTEFWRDFTVESALDVTVTLSRTIVDESDDPAADGPRERKRAGDFRTLSRIGPDSSQR
jgi:hypothetical protein